MVGQTHSLAGLPGCRIGHKFFTEPPLSRPDTITAYSLEDNEFWLRHLLSVGSQFGAAIYILHKMWSYSMLNYLAIPVFIVGLIKFLERIWFQWKASMDQFRKSVLRGPDPGPNYSKFMDEYSSKKAEGFQVGRVPLVEDVLEVEQAHTSTIHSAYYFFQTFKPLFAGLILSFQDLKISQSFFRTQENGEKAFGVLEIELGFMYDVLYTKAILNPTRHYHWIRLFLAVWSPPVFILFLFSYRHELSKIDVIITLLLLIGAILLEIYGVILHLSSDWTILRSQKPKDCLIEVISYFRRFHLIPADKRWSDSVSQYNLMSFCLRDKETMCKRIQKFFSIYEMLEKLHIKRKSVTPELKILIFKLLEKKSEVASSPIRCKELLACRGEQVLKEMKCFALFGWCINVEFDRSILLWHIATDICYYKDGIGRSTEREASKLLSDYMLYLLVFCPFMLPNGIGQIRFQDTCAEAIEFFKERKSVTGEKEACSKLLQVCTEVPPSEVKGDRSKSVLFDACRLAKTLQTLSNEKKWEMMSHVWIEILSYAASQCGWQNHAKKLSEGGELLTHVWLLMAHLGLSEQFQISEGHGRVKLVVK
ncbi:hypothetical protein F0562_000065 [Nyssa sinensis]|uniref:DUF4220 domain-containing protein n=1 Tax=Nyssa sinensis TaxID=561372 RepID=A0A5J5C452_9ASTE|nr:hypothetical protein F0562_000065 [Nyssa sinensis]